MRQTLFRQTDNQSNVALFKNIKKSKFLMHQKENDLPQSTAPIHCTLLIQRHDYAMTIHWTITFLQLISPTSKPFYHHAIRIQMLPFPTFSTTKFHWLITHHSIDYLNITPRSIIPYSSISCNYFATITQRCAIWILISAVIYKDMAGIML